MLTRPRTYRKQEKLEAEQAESAQASQALAQEVENVHQEIRREDPKVRPGVDVASDRRMMQWWLVVMVVVDATDNLLVFVAVLLHSVFVPDVSLDAASKLKGRGRRMSGGLIKYMTN